MNKKILDNFGCPIYFHHFILFVCVCLPRVIHIFLMQADTNVCMSKQNVAGFAFYSILQHFTAYINDNEQGFPLPLPQWAEFKMFHIFGHSSFQSLHSLLILCGDLKPAPPSGAFHILWIPLKVCTGYILPFLSLYFDCTNISPDMKRWGMWGYYCCVKKSWILQKQNLDKNLSLKPFHSLWHMFFGIFFLVIQIC